MQSNISGQTSKSKGVYQMTLAESANRAVLPWRSLDAESLLFEALPQQQIDICLMCQHSATHCDNCNDYTNQKRRPKAKIDMELLKEMLRLRQCNKEMCKALKISEPTLIKAKKELRRKHYAL